MDSELTLALVESWNGNRLFVRGGADDDPPKDPPEDPPTDPAPAPEPQTPSAAYVPADDFKTFQNNINSSLQAVTESLQALARTSRPAEPQHGPALPPDATDEEIEQALREGTGAKVFRKMFAAHTAQLDHKYETRAKHIETTASGALSNMALQIAKPQMKHYDKPYIKKAVDAYIDQLPVDQRLSPESHLVVYQAVVGQNMDKIVEDEIQARARAANNKTSGVQPGGASGRANDTPVEPSVKETFGDEAERELRARGRSLDSIAKAFGYKDGAEYLKAARDNEGEGNMH